MSIEILKSNDLDYKIQEQVENLFNQLNSSIKQLPIQEIVEVSNNLIFAVYKEDDQVFGMATMATYKVISGHKGIIEDVIVADNKRRIGLGRKLLEKLLAEGRSMKLDEILLFSGHHRKPAIKLYKSLGFILKDSGLYHLTLN